MEMNDLYVVAYFKDGVFVNFLHAGRPYTPRAYESVESAKRGIKQKAYHEYEAKIFRVGSMEEVVE